MEHLLLPVFRRRQLGEDNEKSLELLRDALVPQANLFCYGQVESPYGSGEYIRSLEQGFGESQPKLIVAEIENKDAIYPCLKRFLGTGA